jgi:hypothetical protein
MVPVPMHLPETVAIPEDSAPPELPSNIAVVGGSSQEGSSRDIFLYIIAIPMPVQRGDFKIKLLLSLSSPLPQRGIF